MEQARTPPLLRPTPFLNTKTDLQEKKPRSTRIHQGLGMLHKTFDTYGNLKYAFVFPFGSLDPVWFCFASHRGLLRSIPLLVVTFLARAPTRDALIPRPTAFSVAPFDSLGSFLRSSLRQSLSRCWAEVHSSEFSLQPTYLPFSLFISRV
jgi:hypothetical protein